MYASSGSEMRQRHNEANKDLPTKSNSSNTTDETQEVKNPWIPLTNPKPIPGRKKTPWEILQLVVLPVYFLGSCIVLHIIQFVVIPIYWTNRDLYYDLLAYHKRLFVLLMLSISQWRAPTTVRVTGDSSIPGQLRLRSTGDIECLFPPRLVLIANHQIYPEWLYLWWTAYTAGYHGNLYVILKESLKWIPIIGPAMQLYKFIFMTRKWASDQIRMRYRLKKLQIPRSDVKGQDCFDPMWLVIFPEGTNLSANTRKNSQKWSEKRGIDDCKHALLPRSTGLQLCLSELKSTVEYVYDCTIAYEMEPEGYFAHDLYNMTSVFYLGRPPKSVNIHWRRFKIADIPVEDVDGMQKWILDRWMEKDELLDVFSKTKKFPYDPSAFAVDEVDNQSSDKGRGFIESKIRMRSTMELAQVYIPILTVVLIINILYKLYNFVMTGRFGG